VSEESQLQVSSNTSLSLTKGGFGLVARGLKDSAILPPPGETEEPRSSVQLWVWFDVRSSAELSEAAEKGDPKAQHYIAHEYFHPFLYAPGKDYAEAAKWYRKAADQGLKESQFNLGVMYDRGTGVAQDHAEAAKWYRKAAEQGLKEAQFNLGAMYASGTGVAQDYVQAYKWMNLATGAASDEKRIRSVALRDSVASRLNPAQIVEAQRLVFEFIRECRYPDFLFYDTEAIRWWRYAAERGNADAQCNLGYALEGAEAVRWYRKAAEQGDAGAQFRLGDMYAEGQGVPQDFSEAVNWFRLAAEQLHPEAQFELGRCYDTGKGVPQDYAEAVSWYRKAADQADARPRFNPDCMEASSWRPKATFWAACAHVELGRCYDTGKGVPQDYAEAANWYRKAADQGDAQAQFCLGVKYHIGQGVAQEPRRSGALVSQGRRPGYR
jgi:uncharacterized protein